MRITIIPASPKTGAATIRALLAKGLPNLEIDALYRNVANAPAEFTSRPGFRAVGGDVSDASTLNLTGSQAVLAITPPAHDNADPLQHAELVSHNVKDAIERSGTVERLVLLSSGGAQFDHDVGEIKTNNIAETVLRKTKIRQIVFARCAYFMENWTASMDTLSGPQPFFFSTITPADWKVPMIAIRDIGETLADALVDELPSSATGAAEPEPYVFELHGPQRYSPEDVRAALSSATGRNVEIRSVERHELRDYFGRIFSPAHVDLWVDMSVSFLPGGVLAPDTTDFDGRPIIHGKTELKEALREAVSAH